jgi:hypothetical protein
MLRLPTRAWIWLAERRQDSMNGKTQIARSPVVA